MLTRDLIRIALLIVTAVLVGALIGHVYLCLSLAVLGYLAWLHHELLGLLKWMRDRKHHAPPEIPGIFEELTLEIDHLRERHKKRKKKLGDYLRQFRQATRALPDATVVLDDHAVVRWANSAARRFLGIHWPDDANQRITNLLRVPELHAFLDARVENASMEVQSPVDPGVHLSVRLAPYGRGQWLFVARDVTELHRANQIRRDFVANVSHELRTPITVFRGYLENLEQQIDDCPESWLTPLEHMCAHAERMESLVEELLLLSRLEQSDSIADPQPVAVAELLADVHKEACNLSAFRDHVFELETDPDLVIFGDARELYSAFSNLVFNAVIHTPERGVITIRWYHDDDGAHMEVADRGLGIPEDHLARITERFYRVDSSRARGLGGTGLGLAIVKHVMTRHDGSLHVASRLGKGSTFRCDFPLAAIVDSRANTVDA